VDNDASLTGGTIQVQASKDGGTNWLNLGSAYTIVVGDLNTNKTRSFTDTEFEGLSGFAEGNIWNFRAIITDIAGNVTNGTQSGTSITVDQIAPTATLVSATADNVINIAEKAAGFNVVAQSNEATGTLYVVDVTTNPTNTYSNIGTNGFATATVTAANTNTNVAVSANNSNIITGSTYKVYTMDAAGNLSAASTGSFTTDLVAPTITSITSTTADGLYGIGSDINFTMNLDEAAIFTANSGNLSLPMALDAGTGNAIRNTDAASSTSLSLTYTVANGHSAADLTHGAGPAVLNGGATWTDAAGNPVVLTLPNPNTFKSAKAIQIDGVPPTFTVAYHLNSVTGPALGVNPTIGIGSNYYIKIIASEELTSAPTISISGLDNVTSPNNNVSNANTLVHVANTQFSYNRVVVETNDNGTDELITITGTDLAGNTATNAVPTNAYDAVAAASGYQAKVDGKRPQPVITLAVPVDYNDGTNDWTNNNPILATVNYGETVQNVTNSVISVTNGTKSNFVNNANTTFTVDVTPSLTIQGTLVTVSVPEGNIINQIKDAGGNFAYGATKSIKYDATAPTTTDNVPSGWQNSNITITFTPDDATGSGVSKVYYTTNGSNPTTSSSFVTSPYQITISTDGIYTIKYYAVDNVGNAEAVKTATNQAQLDKTAPTIAANTITAPTSSTKWNGGNHNITWTTTNITDATSGLATNPISLYYSTNASGPSPTWTLIADNLSNSGSYTWNVPTDINSTDVKVRIDAVDSAGNVASQVSPT
ncbi:MAG TPA: chitobiase/beta-hexosaminidase C-terminal domain-containing protein, partial [Candidatus Kapabacteria bacterium]|nr:chitobiase/beta-hexosaminidase C-terminal domain-containing protein [Candidatus Kapabacteria bacterium]